ncbi:MAG TPA: c-type cytochrome [Pirellulales bacterium]
MTRWRLLIDTAACCLSLLAGCGLPELPGKPDPDSRPVPIDRITDFATLYGTYCAGCHGADGKLGPAPPLSDAIFLTIVPDKVLLRLVDEGRPGTPMPAFSRRRGGPLTDKQVHALAEGIKPHFMTLDMAAKRAFVPPLSEVADLPAYTIDLPAGHTADSDAIARGQRLFAASCAECHGPDGAGDGAGRLNDPDFLLLASNQMLRRIIITGRADLGMPNFATIDGRSHDFFPLSSADIDDLVALLASWRDAGQTQAASDQKSAGQNLSVEERR